MSNKLHYINVGDEGTFASTRNIHTTPADVDAIIQALRQQTKLVLHFHGGLVKEAAGMAIADRLANEYQGAFPVSVVWETGLLETIQDRLGSIHKTRLFRELLKWVIKISLKKLGGEIGARGEGRAVTDASVAAELAKPVPFAEVDMTAASARGAGGALTQADLDTLLPELRTEFEEEMDLAADTLAELQNTPDKARLDEPAAGAAAKGVVSVKLARDLAQIAYKVIRRHVQGTDHGFYPTVVEEICRQYYLSDLGEWVWGGMKLSAMEMWQPNAGLSGEHQHVGTYFLDKLQALQQETGLIIDVVGHSAGSIAICEMFKAMAQQGAALKIRKVIFMAPAVRHDLFKAELLDHPERYASLRMFTMSDAYESKDVLVPYVYTRSLLYLISGALEGGEDVPILGMQRYLTGKPPYEGPEYTSVAAFFTGDRLALSDSSVLRPDATPGFRTSSHKHGDFDNNALTIESVNTLLQA